jgi:hypothetical protein
LNRRGVLIGGVVLGSLTVLVIFALVIGEIQRQTELQAGYVDQLGPIRAARTAQAESAQVIQTRQAELATVEADYNAAQLSFPSEVDSTEVLAHVIATAALNRVTLRSIQARTPVSSSVGSSTYLIYAYDVAAEGELANVSAFLTQVENGPVGTLNLEQIALHALPTPVVTLTPWPTLPAISPFTPTIDPPAYRTALVIVVRVRLADAHTTPVAPRTPVSQQVRIDQIKLLLDQARQQEDWAYAISLLLALRQMDQSSGVISADDSANETLLIEAYIKEGQRRYQAGQYDRAGAAWRGALNLDPASVEARAGLQWLAGLTPTPTPSITPTPTPTPTGTPTLTPTITPTPIPYYVLELSATANTRYPSLGCSWFGFYGRVSTASNYPLAGLTVKVSAPGFDGVETTTRSSGEYEIYLDNKPREERWLVELRQNGERVSLLVEVDSQPDCGSNQIRMDWRREY